MNYKLKAPKKNGTWVMIEQPAGKKLVGCKWIYIVKCRSDGSVDMLKAKLVAKGYTQFYGIDYQETFGSLAKLNSIRILLSLVQISVSKVMID